MPNMVPEPRSGTETSNFSSENQADQNICRLRSCICGLGVGVGCVLKRRIGSDVNTTRGLGKRVNSSAEAIDPSATSIQQKRWVFNVFFTLLGCQATGLLT